MIIEEAHEFIPEGARTPLKDLLNMVALRGRKRGLGAIIMSQRSASVAKSFLTQAEMLFLHRVVHPTDLRVYKDLIPLSTKQVEDMVGQLQPGQVVFVYNHAAQQVQIRQRHTFHAGATPQLDAQMAGKLQRIDKKLLDKLAAAVKSSSAGTPAGGGSDIQDRQAKKIKELEAEVARLTALVNDKAEQISTLQDLEVLPEVRLSVAKPAPVSTPAKPSLMERLSEQKKLQEEKPVQAKTGSAQLRKELNDYDMRRLQPQLNKLEYLNDKEITLFTYLLERDGTFVSRLEIMAYTGMYMRNFHRDFGNLIKTPFVENRTVPSAVIRSRVSDWAKTVFPGVEPMVIVSKVKNYF